MWSSKSDYRFGFIKTNIFRNEISAIFKVSQPNSPFSSVALRVNYDNNNILLNSHLVKLKLPALNRTIVF